MSVTPHDRWFVPLFLGAAALAWVALAIWSASPYARYLHHDWAQLAVMASLCASLPGGATVVAALLFVGGWTLMTAAMMLPTTLPLLIAFRRLTRRQPRPAVLLALLLLGYVATWLGFGLAAHLAGLALLELGQTSAWLTFNGWMISAGVLLLAGLFQFSSLKDRCLDVCHTPLGFIMARWHGVRPALESLRLGLAHGAYCVGCCWLLMLLLFGVGTGSIAWMLGVGAIMALEKNSRWGRRMARPLGLALVGLAIGIVAHKGWPQLLS